MNRSKTLAIAFIAVLAAMSLSAANAVDAMATETAIKTVRLTVPGADCASAGAEADTLLREIEGVTEVDIDIENTTADISYDPSKTSLESIREIMKAGDYPVTGVEDLKD